MSSVAQTLAELQDHLEARVAQRTTELQAANEELRAFARSVSHYLRTPLQLLMGHAALLDTASEQTRGTHTQAIMNTTDRMADILSGLLQYGERQAGPLTLEQVDLAEVLELSWQDLGGPAPTVKLELGPLPTVRGDYTALRLVFGNLLHNAVKYTQGRPDPRVQVRATRSQNMHLIEVRDNGMGFHPADAERLFRLFSRLPEAQAFDGLGVGLADVWRIVIAHGGHVWAEGRPGEGATFTVSLPADEA
ncbi:sensor histidine kinase [Deinococcus gobiensis]|uniref:histidine kinase n=1 Tax=Deinococcus gobiensis (strain DSM 21396 / JCM 16679 / CGMCC 1.7299 / I-0) TaxID=745776 RepID=H8H265_DEIGI|nr:HAMP domain-containing sensor histidine kinase [Deinococcus gobiensis]AFD27612.1 ATPase, histidine kinase-, DNA gyrase B-, and HSP90-like domain protein [Deinococcus gobiensis I-0]